MQNKAMKPNLFHEDNLVRFLNEVSFGEEIITTLGLELDDELIEPARSILRAREKLGAFFDIYDVESALDLKSKLGEALMKAARRPMFMGPAVQRIPSTGPAAGLAVMSSSMLAPALMPGGIVFAIVWEGIPQDWVRPLMFLLIEVSGKRLGIELKLKEAEAAVADAERQLSALGTQQNPDEGVLAEAQGKLADAKSRVKAVEREAEALNNLLKKKDHRGVWAIVKRNLQAEILALRQRASAMPTTTPQEAEEKRRVEEEADRKQRDIERVDLEVAAYNPPG